MKPLVSIVIPNYNNGKYILDSIKSASLQDYENIEIIVVDDGSTDDSLQVLSETSYPIALHTSINLGAASARNIGILAARGEYIALLDSDDLWETNKISLQIDFLIANQLDLVYCSGVVFGETVECGKILKAEYMGDCYKFFKKYPSRAIVQLGCSGAVFRKKLLSQIGLFDIGVPGPTEDWDFFRRFSKKGQIGFCSEILVHYRRHANNISGKSARSYYLGNSIAVLKMIHDDLNIGFVERRIIWFRFQYISAKSFAKIGNYFGCCSAIARIILPLP